MLRSLNARSKVECYLNPSTSLISRQTVSSQTVTDCSSGWHVPHLDPVHLPALGTLYEGLGWVFDQILQTSSVWKIFSQRRCCKLFVWWPVVGVETLRQWERGVIMITHADATFIIILVSGDPWPWDCIVSYQITATRWWWRWWLGCSSSAMSWSCLTLVTTVSSVTRLWDDVIKYSFLSNLGLSCVRWDAVCDSNHHNPSLLMSTNCQK